ncbi:MAG: hypothetical protein ABIG44_05155 [Planctomycetota bacterium]
MPPTKQLLKFLVRLILLYTLLVIPWPGLMSAYAAAYRMVNQVLFHSFGSYGTVALRPAAEGQKLGDTEAVMTTRRPRMSTTLPLSSRHKGYLPTISLIALVLATPIPWRRRGWALLWGLLLINAFVALRTALAILNAFVNDGPASQTTSLFARELCRGLTVALAETPASYFIGSILIWIVVTFRRGDWLAARNPERYTDDQRPSPERGPRH